MKKKLQKMLTWRCIFPLSLALLCGLTLLTGWRAATAQSNQMKITYLNVGQGDSALVQGPDGFDILIDGGDTDDGLTVVAYLQAQGIDDIDVMLASHNDADHIGGLVDVLEGAIPVRQVLYNGYDGSSGLFLSFATAAAVEGAALQAAQFPAEYTWGVVKAYILNPAPGIPGSPPQNDVSVVALLEYGNQRFFFPGDIESNGEAQALSRQTPLAAEVLKVAHHGSDTSSSQGFLEAVQSTDAVISVGENNPFDHPDQVVLDRLQAAGIHIWRTDLNRTIWVQSDGMVYQIWAELMNPVRLPVVHSNLCQPLGLGQVQITTIFYDGVVSSKEPDEYVEIVNQDACPIQLAGWAIQDASATVFTFPTYVIAPGQTCRIYTNEDHPEWCGFNMHRGNPVWSNTGECGSLWNDGGTKISEFCYS